MIDFNNPNLTTQMKQDLLSLENPEVLMKRIKDSKIAVEKGLGNYSSRSYWIIKPSQLFDLNRFFVNPSSLVKSFKYLPFSSFGNIQDVTIKCSVFSLSFNNILM